MKIAISGCGITGAATAFFLSKAGFQVTIFEQADKCGPIGAGIMLQPSGQGVLQRMGLLDSIADCSEKLFGMTAMRSSGKRLVHLRFDRLREELFAYGVHRGRLFETLFAACQQQGTQVVNSARVVGCEIVGDSQPKVRIKTEHPEVGKDFGEFDFLIAADGSRSVLRERSSIKTKVIDYEYAAFWLTGISEYQPGELFQLVDGTKYLIGLLPIGGGESSYFWGLPAEQNETLRESSFEAWREKAVGLCPQSESILAKESSFDRFTFARYRHVIMRTFSKNRVLYLGDAAHATSPHLGQGVNLGLEDAECFAECLIECRDFEKACQNFERRRKRKIRFYQQLTRMLSPFFQANGSWRGVARDIALPWLPSIPFIGKEMLRTLSGSKKGWFG